MEPGKTARREEFKFAILKHKLVQREEVLELRVVKLRRVLVQIPVAEDDLCLLLI